MKARAALAFCLALAASLAVASPTFGAVTIGSNLSSTVFDNGAACNSADCTIVTLDAPPALQAPNGLRSPIDGVVTSWKFKVNSANSLALRVLRPAGGVSFQGIETSSAVQPTGGGVIEGPFLTNLPIKTGDAIGLDGSMGAVILGDGASSVLDYWNSPPLAGGSTRMGSTSNGWQAPVQAIVEPTSTTTTNPNQSLTAKKRQKLSKAAVTDTLDKSATVSLQARVKLPSGSHARVLRAFARKVKSKKSKATLTADTKTKIKIKFSHSARNKVKAAIAASGKPSKVVVTSTATDSFGNSSTAKVRFKLTG